MRSGWMMTGLETAMLIAGVALLAGGAIWAIQ
jgi:hypothetical protein